MAVGIAGSSFEGRAKNMLVPARLVNVVRRLAGFRPGQAYRITIFLSSHVDGEAEMAVEELGKVENQRGR